MLSNIKGKKSVETFYKTHNIFKLTFKICFIKVKFSLIEFDFACNFSPLYLFYKIVQVVNSIFLNKQKLKSYTNI